MILETIYYTFSFQLHLFSINTYVKDQAFGIIFNYIFFAFLYSFILTSLTVSSVIPYSNKCDRSKNIYEQKQSVIVVSYFFIYKSKE
jgi:hypothetical protein